MLTVNIGEAKDRFSELVRRAERGEEVVIARDGSPVVELRPRAAPKRVPGRLEGRFVVRDDFDDPMPQEWLDAMHDGAVVPPQDA